MIEGTTLFHRCIITESNRSPCKVDLFRLSQNKGCGDRIVLSFVRAGMLGNNRQFFRAKEVGQAFKKGSTSCKSIIAGYHFAPWMSNSCINTCPSNLMQHCCF